MDIDPADATPHQLVALDQQQQLSAAGLSGRWQTLQQLEQLAAVAQMAVGDLADHPLLVIFARMDSVAAAYTAIDPVELLVIAHNSRTDCCTVHQWLTKFFGGRLRRPCLKPKTNSQR